MNEVIIVDETRNGKFKGFVRKHKVGITVAVAAVIGVAAIVVKANASTTPENTDLIVSNGLLGEVTEIV
jgi:hypothetical protein